MFRSEPRQPRLADELEWQREAACIGKDPELWFPEGRATRRAKYLCNHCPVQAQCLEYSFRTKQYWGLWGGVSQWERRRALKHSTRSPAFDPSTM